MRMMRTPPLLLAILLVSRTIHADVQDSASTTTMEPGTSLHLAPTPIRTTCSGAWPRLPYTGARRSSSTTGPQGRFYAHSSVCAMRSE